MALLDIAPGVSRVHASRRAFDLLQRHGIDIPVIHSRTFTPGAARASLPHPCLAHIVLYLLTKGSMSISGEAGASCAERLDLKSFPSPSAWLEGGRAGLRESAPVAGVAVTHGARLPRAQARRATRSS